MPCARISLTFAVVHLRSTVQHLLVHYDILEISHLAMA
jgi:hypothetical protein